MLSQSLIANLSGSKMLMQTTLNSEKLVATEMFNHLTLELFNRVVLAQAHGGKQQLS